MCSGSGPGWVPASDELFAARPACKGGLGAALASAWPAGDSPCPEQGPVLVPGARLGEGVADRGSTRLSPRVVGSRRSP